MNIDIKNQENSGKRKKIVVIFLSGVILITLIAGFFIVKKNKKDSHENNNISDNKNSEINSITNVSGNLSSQNNSEENKNSVENHHNEEIKKEEGKKSEEKNNADHEEGNKDDQKETDDLPWLFTWKGVIFDSVISFIIVYNIFKRIIYPRYPEMLAAINDKKCGMKKTLYILLWVFVDLFFWMVVFPPLFAIQKYKNKSYWERFKLIENALFSVLIVSAKVGAILIIVVICVGILIGVCVSCLNKQ